MFYKFCKREYALAYNRHDICNRGWYLGLTRWEF